MKQSVNGLWCPLVTPMYYGTFDEQSMKRLMATLEPFVDGYVPAMTTGEGNLLSDELWEKVVDCVGKNTSKPVIAAILGRTEEGIIDLAQKAQSLGCLGIGIPAIGGSDEEKLQFCNNIAARAPLPILVYNLEGSSFSSVEAIKALDQIDAVMAIKDSSGDKTLFRDMVQAKSNGELMISVLQGVEYNTEHSQGTDGYLTALINVEPELSKKLYNDYSKVLTQEIMDKFWQYNLGGEWYVTLKAMLYCRKVLRSAEQVKPTISPGGPSYP